MATYEEIKKNAEKVNSYNKGVGTSIPTFKQYVNNGVKDLVKTINATGQSIADSFARVGNGMIDTFEGILDFTQQSYLMVKNSKNIIDLGRNLSGRGTWDIETQKQIQSIKDNDFIRNQFNLASKKEMLNDTRDSYLQTTKVGNLVGSALEGVGQTLPMIAVSTATGGLYSLGVSKQIVDTANAIVKNANLIGIGLSSAGQSVNEAVDSGAEFGKAYKYGLVKGAIESATETIGGESITNKVPTIYKTNKNASLVQRLLKDVSAEGVEEVVSDLADPFAKSIYQKESLNAFKDVDYYKGLGESFLVGSLSSLMSSGVALTDKNTRITNLVDTQMALAENYNKTNDTIEREKIIKQITNNNESISKLVQSLDDVSKETYIKELGKIGINLNEDGTVIKNDKFIKSDYVSLNANSDIVENQMERINKKLKTKVSITTEMNETQKENYNKFQNLMENRNQQTGNQVDYVVLDNMGNAHGGIVGNTIYIAKEDFNDDTWKYTSTHEWEHFTEDTVTQQEVKLGDFRKNTKTEITQREVNTESRSNLLYEIDKTQLNNGVLNEKGKQTIDSMVSRNYISQQEGEMLKNGTAEEITRAFNDKESFTKEFYAVASEKLLSNDNYINKLVRGDKTLLNIVLNKIEDISLKSKIGTEEYKTFKSIEKAFNKALESKGYKYHNRKIISSSDIPEFNLKTWRDKTILVGDKYYSGKEILTDTLKKENWSQNEINKLVGDVDMVADLVEELQDQYDVLKKFNNIVPYYRPDGSLMLSCLISNGEYDLNIDFSTICKKRENLSRFLNEYIEKGYEFGKNGFSKQAQEELENLFKKYGLDTACTFCFVESRRKNVDTWSAKFERLWKQALASAKIKDAKPISSIKELSNIDVIDGITDSIAFDIANIMESDALEQASNVERVLEIKNSYDALYTERRKQNPKASPNTLERMEEYLSMVAEDYVKKGIKVYDITAIDLLNTKVITYVKANMPELYSIFLTSYGANAPKQTLPATPYTSNLLIDTEFSRNDIVKHTFEIGGVRINSFSDFNISRVLDYIQFVADASAKGMAIHTYTKVIAMAELLGKSGLKMNLSLIPEVDLVAKAYYESKGLNPKDYAGLDKDGNYVFSSDSIDADKTFELQEKDGYKGNIGSILVGISRYQIIKALNDNKIKMIIPYHSSGMPKHLKIYYNHTLYTDYQSFQNTMKCENGKLSKVGNDPFLAVFYESYHKNKGNYRKATSDYLQYCKENNLVPRFALEWNENESFEQNIKKDKNYIVRHPNYYKVLIDFTSDGGYNSNGGLIYKMQEGVKLNLDGIDVKGIIERESKLLQEDLKKFENSKYSMFDEFQKALNGKLDAKELKRVRDERIAKENEQYTYKDNVSYEEENLEFSLKDSVEDNKKQLFEDKDTAYSSVNHEKKIALKDGDVIYLGFPKTNHASRVTDGYTYALSTHYGDYVIRRNGDLYRFSARDYWRLTGYSDEDILKVKQVVNQTAMYQQAGNSMAVPVMESIFKNLNLKKGARVIELFGGIGSSTTALKNIGVSPTIVDYVEWNPKSVQAYNVMNEENFSPKDIMQYTDKHDNIDLLVFGSPCQSNSKLSNSQQKGMAKGSNQKSALIWDGVATIERDMPKNVVWENVVDAERQDGYKEFLDKLESLGYKLTTFSLNAIDFGVPQVRSRTFVVARLEGDYKIPKGNIKTPHILNYLGYSDSDIQFSFKDSDGNNISQEQYSYFSNSKVVDENGALQVVYHGTDSEFTVFDRTKSRANMDIQGYFFSPYEIEAQGYGKNVKKYYLNITNPATESQEYKALNMFKGENNAGIKARDYLIKQGYDGVIGYDEYIAFYPEQIKLVSNTIPTSNEDIRFSRKSNNDYIEKLTDEYIDEHWKENAESDFMNYTLEDYNEMYDTEFETLEEAKKHYLNKYDKYNEYDYEYAKQQVINNLKERYDIVQDKVFKDISKYVEELNSQTDNKITFGNQYSRSWASGNFPSWYLKFTTEDGNNDFEIRISDGHDNGYGGSTEITYRDLDESYDWTLSNIKTMIEDNLTGQDGFDDVRFSYKDINFDDIQKEHSRQDKILTKSQVEEFLYNQFKKEGYLFSHKKAMDMAEYIARAYNGSRTSTEYKKIVDRIVDSYLDAIKWTTADKNGYIKQEDYLDLTEDDINYIKEVVGKRIAKNFKFKDTKKSELIDNYNRFINEMKADYQEIIERQKYASLCEQSARKLKDMKYGAFQNATKYKDVDFQKAIFNLSKISFRGKFNESGTRKLIKELSDWYVLDNPIISPSFDQQDKTIGANWNEEIANIMEDIAVGDGRIANEELQNIAKVLDYFKRFIETYNKIWRNGRLVDATEYGNNYLKVAKYSQEHAKDNIYNKFERAKLTTSYNELFNDPMSLARRYDAYKDGFLTNTMNEFREASINIGLMEMRLREELDKFLEKYDKGLSNTYIDRLFKTNITVNENEMPLNVGLSLYLTMAQYDSWDGLLLSGFDWYDEENNRHDVKPLASELQDKLALGQDITDEDKLEVIRKLVQEIKSQLTPEDKEYIKIVSRTFNDKCKEEKRKTDMFVNGYSNVRDGIYYPLSRANTYKSIDSDSYISEVDRVSSKSFNKERISNKNRLVISAVNKVFDKHVRGISQYCNLTMPIQNFNRLYNMPLESSQYSNKVSLKREIELVWKNADTYLNTLLDDIQGKTTSEDSIKSKTSNVLNSLRGHTAVFQLGANPKVLATQWSSLLASTSILEYNSIIKGLNIKVSDSEIEKNCELAKLRAYDKTIIKAESVTDKVSKIGEKLMSGISWMDRQVVKTLYGACQVEVKTKYNLEIGTEDNKVKAGELLKQVILETQQNTFATDRSSAMRSNNQLNKTLTMYTADAMKCYGRFIDALGEYSMVKNNGTVEEVNKAKKKVFKSLGAVTTNSIFQALIGLLFNHLLAKDDEEDIKSVLADIGGNMIGALPVVKEVYNFFSNGYEINDSNMSLINDMLANGKNFAKIIFSGEGDKVPYILKSIVDTIGRFTGIPTRNIYNYTTGLIRRFSEKSGYIIDDFFYTKKYNSDLVKYAEEDNQDMLEVIYGQILKDKTSSTSKAVSEELARLYSSGYKVSISDSTYKDNVDTMIKYESYAKLTDEQKYKAINYLYNMSDKNKLFSKVISPEKLAVIYGYTYNLKSDEKSTKKEKVTSYVSKLKLSAVEKYIVMGMLGYKNSNGKDQVESYIKKLGLNKEERTLLLEYCGYEN